MARLRRSARSSERTSWLKPSPCEPARRRLAARHRAAAIEAINEYLAIGDLTQGIVYDACRARLIEIGEAVKGLDSALLATEPTVPWRSIARMRDHLAHRYFDTDHAIVEDVVRNELSPLRIAVEALLERAREAAD